MAENRFKVYEFKQAQRVQEGMTFFLSLFDGLRKRTAEGASVPDEREVDQAVSDFSAFWSKHSWSMDWVPPHKDPNIRVRQGEAIAEKLRASAHKYITSGMSEDEILKEMDQETVQAFWRSMGGPNQDTSTDKGMPIIPGLDRTRDRAFERRLLDNSLAPSLPPSSRLNL